MAKLPKVIYVKRETNRSGGSYLTADTNLFNMAEADEITVGVYHWTKNKKVNLLVQSRDIPS